MLREFLRSELEESVLMGVERDQLCSLLLEFHEVFSLERGERGEQARWVPFAVRKEIARNLKDMQDGDVFQPSNSL